MTDTGYFINALGTLEFSFQIGDTHGIVLGPTIYADLNLPVYVPPPPPPPSPPPSGTPHPRLSRSGDIHIQYGVNPAFYQLNGTTWTQLASTNSPVFTGTPTVPTPTLTDSSSTIASTSFVQGYVQAQGYVVNSDLDLYARLDSPVFTGAPQAPTPTLTDSSTSLATTAFVSDYVQTNLALAKLSDVSITPNPPTTNTPLVFDTAINKWSSTAASVNFSVPASFTAPVVFTDVTTFTVPAQFTAGLTVTTGNGLLETLPGNFNFVFTGVDSSNNPTTIGQMLFGVDAGGTANTTSFSLNQTAIGFNSSSSMFTLDTFGTSGIALETSKQLTATVTGIDTLGNSVYLTASGNMAFNTPNLVVSYNVTANTFTDTIGVLPTTIQTQRDTKFTNLAEGDIVYWNATDNFFENKTSNNWAPLDSPVLTGLPQAPTVTVTDNSSSIATTSFVQTLLTSDLSTYAPLESPVLSGTPTVPTPALTDNSETIVNSGWIVSQGYATVNQLFGFAPLISPAFLGNPTAPTVTSTDNSTSIATTEFVQTALTSYALLDSPIFVGSPTAPTVTSTDNSNTLATTSFIHGQGFITSSALVPYAPLNSPEFSGSPTSPTPTLTDNSSSIATTAFVQTLVQPLATVDSPNFTGTPTAPTPALTDNSTTLATTAYVTQLVNSSTSTNTNIKAITAPGNYTVLPTDYIVIFNKTIGETTNVNLPAGQFGKQLILKDGRGDADSNNIIIQSSVGDLIDGQSVIAINEKWESTTIVFNGTMWNVI